MWEPLIKRGKCRSTRIVCVTSTLATRIGRKVTKIRRPIVYVLRNTQGRRSWAQHQKWVQTARWPRPRSLVADFVRPEKKDRDQFSQITHFLMGYFCQRDSLNFNGMCQRSDGRLQADSRREQLPDRVENRTNFEQRRFNAPRSVCGKCACKMFRMVMKSVFYIFLHQIYLNGLSNG